MNRQKIEVDTDQLGPPWWPRWMAFAEAAAKMLGGTVEAAGNIFKRITEHDAFENVVNEDFWIPSSSWPVDEVQHHIGVTMGEDIQVKPGL